MSHLQSVPTDGEAPDTGVVMPAVTGVPEQPDGGLPVVAEEAGAPAMEGAPELPADDVVPPERPFRELQSTVDRRAHWETRYNAMLLSGQGRLGRITNPQQVAAPQPPERFRDDYTTDVGVANEDSPTGYAMLSRWNGALPGDHEHGYKNTPLPGKGIILSWQNQAATLPDNHPVAEPLRNADVYFHQYRTAYLATRPVVVGEQPAIVLPKLTKLRRQNVMNGDTGDTLYHLQWLRDFSASPIGTYGPHSDAFVALLGTPNGSAAAYLVIQYGPQLHIDRIVSIEVTPMNELVFTFD